MWILDYFNVASSQCSQFSLHLLAWRRCPPSRHSLSQSFKCYRLSTSTVLCTSSRTPNIWDHRNHWEATWCFTIPPPACVSFWDQYLSRIFLLRLGPNSLVRPLIRLGYWDFSYPSFISQYGLFPGPYFLPSNTLGVITALQPLFRQHSNITATVGNGNNAAVAYPAVHWYWQRGGKPVSRKLAG